MIRALRQTRGSDPANAFPGPVDHGGCFGRREKSVAVADDACLTEQAECREGADERHDHAVIGDDVRDGCERRDERGHETPCHPADCREYDEDEGRRRFAVVDDLDELAHVDCLPGLVFLLTLQLYNIATHDTPDPGRPCDGGTKPDQH